MTLGAARSGAVPPAATLASLTVACLGWGLAYPLTHIALDGLDPWSMRIATGTLGGGTLLAFAALTGSTLRVPRALWRDLAICALFNMTLCQGLMMFGVYFMGAGRTSVLVYTMPIWATLFARWLLGERVTRRRVVALMLGALAVVVLLSQNLDQMRNAPIGALLTLGSAAAFGFGTVWLKRWPLQLAPPALAGWQLLLGGVPFVAIWLVAVRSTAPLGAPASAWVAVVSIALVSNAVAYGLWFRLVPRLPAAVASIGTLATPCVGVFSSALLIGEAVQPNDLIALALVCGALVLVLFERRPVAAAPGGPTP